MHATNAVVSSGTLKSAISPDYAEIDCRHWLQLPTSAITKGTEQ